MSRIIRSLDTDRPAVDESDLLGKPLDDPKPDRPKGGFAFDYKSSNTREHRLSVIEQREQESVRLLEEAKLEAQRIAERVQREAYEAGFEQGEKAGEKLAAQKAEPLVATLEQLIQALQQDRQRLIEHHEQDLIKIAFSIATEVLKTTLEMQPEVVSNVVEAALSKIATNQKIELCVSPLDYQLVHQYIEQREGEGWDREHFKIVTDENIGRGGCRVNTETGDIDATLETQLRVLKNILWNE